MGSIGKACISGFLCRLCSEMHRIVIHIYGTEGTKRSLVEKINGYLPITISPTDPLPKTICESCLKRVEQHYLLLIRLSRIQEGKNYLRSIKIPRLPQYDALTTSDEDDSDLEIDGASTSAAAYANNALHQTSTQPLPPVAIQTSRLADNSNASSLIENIDINAEDVNTDAND